MCGVRRAVQPGGDGWRLYRVDDPDDECEEILAAYCKICAMSEFGGSWVERKEADYDARRKHQHFQRRRFRAEQLRVVREC